MTAVMAADANWDPGKHFRTTDIVYRDINMCSRVKTPPPNALCSTHEAGKLTEGDGQSVQRTGAGIFAESAGVEGAERAGECAQQGGESVQG